MKKYTVLPLFLIAVSVLNFSCSKEEESPKYEGYWRGVTSQGKAISFNVTGEKVTTINLKWDDGPFCSGPDGVTINFTNGLAIYRNSFSNTGSLSVSGIFNSPTSVTGSFTYDFPAGGGCSSISATWSANK